MEFVIVILGILAIASIALSSKPKPKPTKSVDEQVKEAWWKGYQAGYNAHVKETQKK